MESSCGTVLRNPNLVGAIVQYQCGLKWCVVRHLAVLVERKLEPFSLNEQQNYCLHHSHDRYYAFHKLIADGNLVGVRDLLPYFDSDRAMDVAAIWGQLQVLMYLHLRSAFGCTSRAMDYAAAYGHVDCVAFLRAHRSEGCSQQALTYAAANGHLECVKYLWRHPPSTHWFFAAQAEEAARANKHWAVVKFLRRSLNNRASSPLERRATSLFRLLWS